MSKTNNRRLRARIRDLERQLEIRDHVSRCAYCDEVLLNTELRSHATLCPEHPCRELERTLARHEVVPMMEPIPCPVCSRPRVAYAEDLGSRCTKGHWW